MNEKKVLIIVPAYNEEGNIQKTIENLQEACEQCDYVIINDGSRDATADICKKRKYTYIDLPVNLGLAGAFQTGMKYAYQNGYEYALQLDGDGQHDPKYVLPMLEYGEKKKADIVIGSRFLEKKKPHSMRMAGSRIIVALIRMTTGRKLTDPTSGMRLYNRKVMKRFTEDVNLEPEPDMLAYLLRCGARIEEYSVQMKDREKGKSYLNFSTSIKYMTRICCSILFVQWFRERRL